MRRHPHQFSTRCHRCSLSLGKQVIRRVVFLPHFFVFQPRFICVSTKVYLHFNQGLFVFQPRFIYILTKVYLCFYQGLFVFQPLFVFLHHTTSHLFVRFQRFWPKCLLRGRARTCREPFLSMTPEQCRRWQQCLFLQSRRWQQCFFLQCRRWRQCLFCNVGGDNNVFFVMSEVKQCYGKEIRKWCRSRCPEQCLRLGPDDINLYLGVTDRFHHLWRLRSVGVCVKISISVGDLCQNLRAAGPKPEPVEVSKIHIHPGWDRWGLRVVTMTMGGHSSNSQNPDRHWHFIDSCLELTSTWLLKRNITW